MDGCSVKKEDLRDHGYPAFSGVGGDGRDAPDPAALAGDAGEPPQILLEDGVGSHAVLEAGQLQVEFPGRRAGQGIDHPLAMSAGRGETLFSQVGQVLGNGDLRRLKHRLEMADAERAFGQQVEDAKSGFVAKTTINLD